MKAFWIIVVLIVLIGAGWYYYDMRNKAVTPPEKTDDMGIQAANKNKALVQMTSTGFMPSELRIKPGFTVEFVNADTKDHWPASGIHPAHQLCPGFDSRSPVTPGSKYSFQFTSPRECPMHDHLNPALKGKIIVEP